MGGRKEGIKKIKEARKKIINQFSALILALKRLLSSYSLSSGRLAIPCETLRLYQVSLTFVYPGLQFILETSLFLETAKRYC